jgi:hypothetical protein
MKFAIPQTLQHEHEALHERLRQATQAGGEVGEAAKALARGEWSAEMAEVLALTEQLEVEWPQMLAEHEAIVAALNTLREAAARAGRGEIVAFAEALIEHARTEEEVMYPAAVLVGQVVRQRLGQLAGAVA